MNTGDTCVSLVRPLLLVLVSVPAVGVIMLQK